MATPDEVRASLLASGDHGRDGCARRKVADAVKAVTRQSATDVMVFASIGDSHGASEAVTLAGLAASAVVLASDLRAPTETRAEFVRRIAERVKTVPIATESDADAVTATNPLGIIPKRQVVSPNRQGWRARLAGVERLLAASLDSRTPRQAAETVADALAEVRAMIDGEDE
jgi:DNA-binding NarL/FixJ family response regulator